MSPARGTFFSIPELVSCLRPFLDREDLIQLLQTNRVINSSCTPLFWRELDLSANAPHRLLNSPIGLEAFYSNVNSVRNINWNNYFSWYYIHSLYDYLNSDACSPAHKHISTDALSHPTWGQLMTPNESPVLPPMPPMLRLTHCTSKLKISYWNPHSNLKPRFSKNNLEPHQHQLLWLFRLNKATLHHIKLHNITLLSLKLIRDTCRTLSQLRHLRTLYLKTPWRDSGLSLSVLKMLFFSCPSSLVELTLLEIANTGRDDMHLDPKESDWDFDQGPLTLRQEPLHHLKAIELSTMDIMGDNLALTLCSILKHCATLEKLTLPSFRDSTNIQDVSKTIGDHCPYITNLCTSPPNGQETFMCIMERLPEQQLQTLQATDIFDESSSALSSTVFARHSQTLQTIVFPAPQILKSTTLQAILMFCQALEVLKAHDDYSIYNTLAIEDAVATEWACTRIRHLEIAVEFTPDGRDPGYLADATKMSWKKQDHEHWGMLDKFYTQIGKLENLEVLHIKSAKANLPLDEEEDDEDEEIPYSATCLPGLLALEDEATGQIGFLSRWAGLTKLQDLRGSFLVTAQEAAARMGEREAEWFVTHLPALRRATLWNNPYSEKCSDDDVPDVVRIIQRHRPELVL